MTEPESTRPPSGGRRRRGLARAAFDVISSPRLAIALLVAVLACCLVAATAFDPEDAWRVIFSALWFNGLLVALAISSGLTFLVRYWGRRLTVISVGMILFHVCFLTMLGGVVYNGLFHFKGILRLAEGETLPLGDPASYDVVEAGRWFDFARLRGEATLVKMHVGYKVAGLDKRAAYEITVGQPGAKVTDVIYMTQNLEVDRVRFLVEKEGYCVGVVLQDRAGQDLYAGLLYLQSLKQKDGSYLYSTGTAQGAGAIAFPAEPAAPDYWLQVIYVPKLGDEQHGEVVLDVSPWVEEGHGGAKVTGRVPLGGRVEVDDRALQARELRYWVGMNVRHDPGLTVILASLWTGLGGMAMTFVGRIVADARREKRASQRPPAPPAGGSDT